MAKRILHCSSIFQNVKTFTLLFPIVDLFISAELETAQDKGHRPFQRSAFEDVRPYLACWPEE